jgi:hypothetical protein
MRIQKVGNSSGFGFRLANQMDRPEGNVPTHNSGIIPEFDRSDAVDLVDPNRNERALLSV